MTCEQVREGLREYLDAATPPGDLEPTERHLRDCAGCRRQLDELRWTIRYLGALPRLTMPAAMKARLLDAFQDRQSA